MSRKKKSFLLSDEEVEWTREIMNGVLAARTAIDAANRPRGTQSNPALSCRDLRTTHPNATDGRRFTICYRYSQQQKGTTRHDTQNDLHAILLPRK